MIDKWNNIKLHGPHSDSFVVKNPVQMYFRGKTASAKRMDIGRKVIDLLKRQGFLQDGAVYGSASYQGAKNSSDVDIAGITSKRPYSTYLLVQHPKTGEVIRTRVRGYRMREYTLRFGGRTSLGINFVMAHTGSQSAVHPRVWRRNTSLMHVLSADIVEQVRTALLKIYRRGVRTVTPRTVMEEMLDTERETHVKAAINRKLKNHKGRLKRGLRKLCSETYTIRFTCSP